MSQKIFITGSSDGLGLLAAKALASRGHAVYLHGRNAQRTADAHRSCPEAKAALTADLCSLQETKDLAAELNSIGPFDAIIHNAGLYRGVSGMKGKEGYPALFAVNVLAPYVLSCLVTPPAKRMIYLSSSLHQGGTASLTGDKLQNCGYGDSKLYNIVLANAFAQRYRQLDTVCNALDPGWVPTKMGGASAMDDIDAAVDTYVMLALGEGESRGVNGGYWYQCKQRSCRKEASDGRVQSSLLAELEKISGIDAPASS